MLRFAGFELDHQRAELRGPDGEAIRLRPKSFAMLHVLAAHAGRVVSKQELMEAVWPNIHVGEDSLFQCIREIRAALGDDARRSIKAVSGRGYLFEAEVSSGPEPVAAAYANGVPAGAAAGPGTASEAAKGRWFSFGLRHRVAAIVAGLCAVAGFAAAVLVFKPEFVFKAKPPALAVMPVTMAGEDAHIARMAAQVTDRLTDGLARIETIRVVAAPPGTVPATPAELVLSSELQKGERSWELRARLTRSASREVAWSTTVSVVIDDPDPELQQSRLAAGLGHRLASHLNALRHNAVSPGSAKVVIEQATASINKTSRERFAVAQTMLEQALSEDPENVDLEVALSAHLLRGIMMVWYSPADRIAAESSARAMLQRALRTRPDYLPVLETYCRLLTATNHFVDSAVVCARALTFNPWNGLLLYNLGLTQIYLGRFEDALATFRLADRYDTPEVSRWTWLLGAGVAQMMMGRDEDALPWLQRSIAITPATGRTHFLLGAAYQRLGRHDEAKAALAKTLALRPGSNERNIAAPTKNASPRFLEASEQVIRAAVAAGLPEG